MLGNVKAEESDYSTVSTYLSRDETITLPVDRSTVVHSMWCASVVTCISSRSTRLSAETSLALIDLLDTPAVSFYGFIARM